VQAGRIGTIEFDADNFIRLVHYPHSRYTIEYAAKIGLMVSEEPGLWWHRMADPFVKKCALEIMRRTVLRDRSNPAVVAWLFFNECPLGGAMDYLRRGYAMCRSRIDATAVHAPRVARITQDRDWESYAVNLLSLPADNEKVLRTVTVRAADRAFELVIYAISSI